MALVPATAHAAAPSNDNFAGALTLPVGGQVQGNNVDATGEANEPTPTAGDIVESDCTHLTDGPQCTDSVWYTFAPATSGPYTIETCDLGTNIDTVLAVYDGGLTSLHQDAANDDACIGGPGGNGSRVTFSATGGVTYHVEVAGFVAQEGTFWLRSYAGSTPQAVPEPDTQLQQFNSFATNPTDPDLPPTDGPRHSASFAFTSDTDGASFECSLDGAAFTACHSPMSFDGLAGTHTFSVRSVTSGVPDSTPATATFSVDGSPPDSSLTAQPSNPTSTPTVDFSVGSTERSWEDFHLCQLDAQPGQGCSAKAEYNGLCNGPHSFTGAAMDLAGNLDPTPITTSFTETGGTETCVGPDVNVTPAADGPTDEELNMTVNPHGDGGVRIVDYGTTPAYGLSRTDAVHPDDPHANATLSYLTPGTLYHYRVTVTTGAGTVSTGDATFTTPSASGTLPSVSLGTPVVVGTHAVAFPVSGDAGTDTGSTGVLLDTAPIQPNQSPEFDAPESLPGGSFSTAADVVDLDPGTYHVRAFLRQDAGVHILSPEITFTIAAPAGPPVLTPPALPTVKPFKLRSGFVTIASIKHGSKTITLVIRHLPPSTSVAVTVNATVHASRVKFLARGHAKANKAGVAKVKIKLSHKARKVLRSKRTKSLSLKVRVKPPGQTATSLTLHRKLKH